MIKKLLFALALLVPLKVHAAPVFTPAIHHVEVAGATVTARDTINFVSGATVVDNAVSTRTDITILGGGGYAVHPATVTFQLNQGLSASTETITGLSPGVMHIIATSSNVVTALVSLSTEVTGFLPAASIAAGSLGPSVLVSSLAAVAVTPGSYTSTNLTVNQQGQITSASNGSGGGSGQVQAGTIGQNAYYAVNGGTVTGSSNMITNTSSETFNVTANHLFGLSSSTGIFTSSITAPIITVSTLSVTSSATVSGLNSFGPIKLQNPSGASGAWYDSNDGGSQSNPIYRFGATAGSTTGIYWSNGFKFDQSGTPNTVLAGDGYVPGNTFTGSTQFNPSNLADSGDNRYVLELNNRTAAARDSLIRYKIGDNGLPMFAGLVQINTTNYFLITGSTVNTGGTYGYPQNIGLSVNVSTSLPQYGFVGINKSAPTVALDVNGTIAASSGVSASTGVVTSSMAIGTSNFQRRFTLVDAQSGSTTPGTNPVMWIGGGNTNNNTLSEIGFTYGFAGAYAEQFAPVTMGYQLMSGSGHTLGDLVFCTRSATTDSAPTERMRIGNAGGTLFSGNISFNAVNQGIVGTTTGGLSGAGNVGEYFSSATAAATNLPATTQYGDLVSTQVTAGAWMVTFMACEKQNSATITTGAFIGISTTTGNSSTGLVEGTNQMQMGIASATGDACQTISSYPMNFSGATTIYGKMQDAYSVGTPQMVGSIIAIRTH